MNYKSKGYKTIKEAQEHREKYILDSIDKQGVYSTTYIFTIAELNAVQRLKNKNMIEWNEEKWGYIRTKQRGIK